MTDFDVAIIGSGMAGMSAALTARARGASVLLVESSGQIGGSSRLSGGMLMGAGTRLQKRLGIDDDPDAMYRHYMTLNQWNVEPALVRTLVDGAVSAIEWLEDLGVEYRDELVTSGEEGVARMHMPIGEGEAIVRVLLQQCRDTGVEIALGQHVDRLLVEDGRVNGIAVGQDTLATGAVVIATGGFGANAELIAKWAPQLTAVGDWFWYIGATTSTGSAFGLGEQVGAQIAGLGRAARLLTPNFGNLLEGGYFPGWLVMVNAQGRRFFDETSSYSVTQPIVEAQQGPVFAVFDDAARLDAQPATAEAVKKIRIENRNDRAQKWVQSMLDEMIERGIVVRADTLDGLGETIGVPSRNFVGTIERYNADVAAGHDSLYLKRPSLMRPVATPPYYATELRLAHLTVTAVGLRIDADARVLDEASHPIVGLYAAGECTGGVLGDVYVGSGNSVTNCIVFGRIAGEGAAREALEGAARARVDAG